MFPPHGRLAQLVVCLTTKPEGLDHQEVAGSSPVLVNLFMTVLNFTFMLFAFY